MSARIQLAMSAYVPLFVIGFIRFEGKWLRCALSILIMIGIISLFSLIRTSVKRVQPREATPTTVRDLGSKVAAYVASYLLPFMRVDEPDIKDVIAYTIVLLMLGILIVTSDLVGVNPLLRLFGYRVFAVSGVRRLAGGQEADTIVISRDVLVAGSTVTLTDLATGVSFVIPPTEDIDNE